jgi:DNA polymerase III alpha subunit
MKYSFPCGCQFDIVEETIKNDGLPSLYIDYYNIPEDCEATWALIQTGRTKGIFQLESNLGRKWAKELAPSNLEEMSALVSLMRPGCIFSQTKILTNIFKHKDRKYSYRYKTIEDVYNSKLKQIVSYNENTGQLLRNNIDEVIYTGKKSVYRIRIKKSARKDLEEQSTKYHNLICTKDHKILTPHGWSEVGHLHIGDRFAILNCTRSKKCTNPKHIPGQKGFKDICFKHYEYRCIFCDWNNGSLDVNHLDENRKVNNHPDNLCYMCPNHHRMYSEGNITKEQAIQAREKYILPQYTDIMWAEFRGLDYIGEEDVYDICMEGPHHNFIAGKTVVHNCLRAIVDGKSMTQHYCDRKNKGDEVKYLHEALRPILKETYGVLTYQEQSMKIAQVLALFNLQEADVLRKAIGKKKADIMAKVKGGFIEGCKNAGIVSEEEAAEIFGWIQESQRYSFNKSHGIGYGDIGYWSAYAKAHFPLHFFTSWLFYSHEKMKPQAEMRQLISDAKYFNINVYPPSLTKLHRGDPGHFALADGDIYFGIGDVKKIGDSHVERVFKNVELVEQELGRKVDKWTWYDFLIFFSDTVSQTVINGIVAAGATDYMGGSRGNKVQEYTEWRKLTTKEQQWIKDNCKSSTNLLESIRLLLQNYKKITVTRRQKVEEVVKVLENPSFTTKDSAYYIASQETELLGIPVTCSKLDTCKSDIEADTTCREFLQGKTGKCSLSVEILTVRESLIKNGKQKGKKMLYLSLEDGTGTIDTAVVFPDALVGNESVLIEGNTVIICGERDKKFNESLVVNEVIQI